MNKIPTLFQRDPDNRSRVLDAVTPGCEWVMNGEGKPTRKLDGTCMRLDDAGAWWARREVKPGKLPPIGFEPVEIDPVTGKTFGWEPVEQSPFVKFWQEAQGSILGMLPGTYELVGPKVNGNPERLHGHHLVRHAIIQPITDPRAFSGQADQLKALVTDLHQTLGWEGIVWHHHDGRMAKLKARDVA
jgi:hypothetical protein